MSSPSKPLRRRNAVELEGDESADALLVEDAATDPRTIGWKRRALGMPIKEALALAGEVRYLHTKVGPRLAFLVADLGAANDMSRDTYIRHILATHVSQVTGEGYDDLIAGVPATRPTRVHAKGAKLRT